MRSARSHTRPPLSVPDTATSPASTMNSSICVTLRLLVQPLDFHGSTHVSSNARAGSGPSASSRLRMFCRQISLVRNHLY